MRTPTPKTQRHLTPAAIQLYRACDDASGALIYAMVVFSPWAFGTTERWSMWGMNVAAYVLGILLLVKLVVRSRTGYSPPRWARPLSSTAAASGTKSTESRDRHGGRPGAQRSGRPDGGERRETFVPPEFLVGLLAIITGLLVAYCFTAAINARATFDPGSYSFEYREAVRWLPHSLDAASTWFWSWNFLALGLSFWAIRDWLLGKTDKEARQGMALLDTGGQSPFSGRLRGLLWVLTINGGLLALEGLIQRIEGSGHLLFLVKPRVNPGAEAQFGPYAYRGSAASFFNLLWPICLGFWWTLHRYSGTQKKSHLVLLVCAGLMAACPVVSTSRGGALITLALLVSGALFLVLSQIFFPGPEGRRKGRLKTALLLAVFCLAAAGMGYAIGWKALEPRLAELREGFKIREEMFENARPMTRDYPVFGTGPGSFEMVFQLYRKSTDTYWPKQLHNDWLETRITFGWLGLALILAALATVLLRWLARGGIHGGRRFVGMAWLALGGCLVHARYDFPFQIYSILFLFVLLCAILFTLSRRPWESVSK